MLSLLKNDFETPNIFDTRADMLYSSLNGVCRVADRIGNPPITAEFEGLPANNTVSTYACAWRFRPGYSRDPTTVSKI